MMGVIGIPIYNRIHVPPTFRCIFFGGERTGKVYNNII